MATKGYLLIFLFFLIVNVSWAQELYPFLNANLKWSFVDENLVTVIKPHFDYAHPFIEGVAAVENHGRWAFIDKSEKMITQFEYLDLKETSEGLIPVSDQFGKWGFLDLKGKIKIPFIYDDAGSFKKGLAPVSKNGLYGFIDKNGSFKIKSQFRYATEFNEDGFSFVIESNAGVIGSQPIGYIIDTLGINREYLGKTLNELPLNGIYYKNIKGKWGFYDLYTQTNTIPHVYDLVYHFNDGLAPVKKNNKWGYIDKHNKLVIDYKFDDASPFSEGLAAVKVEDKKGYINLSGKFIFDPQFTTAGDFKHGVAEVGKGDQYFYINKAGNLLIK